MAVEVELAGYTKADAAVDYKKWVAANNAYHNGTSIMPDAQFDRLTSKLLPFYPKLDKRVGAAPMAKHASARKVRLLYPMASLDKAYEKELPKLIASKLNPATQAVISEKVDGLSLEYNKNDKGQTSLFTRGKEGVGQDVSHLIPHIHGLGIIANGESIRFELVLPNTVSLKNEESDIHRNAISGIVNSRTVNTNLLAKAYPVALGYLHPPLAPSRAFKKLKAKGWRVPRNQVYMTKELTSKLLTTLYKSWRSRAKYAIDGLVVLADVAEAPKITNPKRGFAFKVNDDGQSTMVVSVQWQVSRYGQMKPVVNVKPVMVDGVKVSKATGHNAKYVVDNKIGPGAIVEIIRSGGVIPYIVGVEQKAAKGSLPKAGTYEWDETHVNILSTDEAHDETMRARQLQTFFSKIGVLGFGPKVAELIADLKIADIARLSEDAWLNKGAGNAVAAKMPGAIKSALKSTTIPKLMAYSGVFGQGFGDTSAQDLWNVSQLKPATRKELAGLLAKLNGWSTDSAKDVAANWPSWVKWFNALPYKPSTKVAKVNTNGPLKGKVISFTGIRDKNLEADIVSAGGTVGSGVTKSTTHLIVKDGFESDKTRKAKAQGVKIIPYSLARAKLKI